jgi:thiosulfate/3-mercaptopyruvate sulfurtransferase
MTRTIDPIITAAWLQAQLQRADSGDLSIIDLRWTEEYAAGHIPGAMSVPFGLQSVWAESGGDFLLELPSDDDLFKLIGDCGLTADSRVVMVGRVEEPPAPQYALADPARAAATLMYAGVRNVAVLSGGHPAWERADGETTTDVPTITPTTYYPADSTLDRDTWVSTDYVKEHVGRAVLIDGRDPDQYFGASIDPFADMRGHIPTARSLPMVWVWERDGTYRPDDLIAGMVAGVIGEDRDQEIITYCGVGGYASTWWFLLTQLLGYKNVKIYDGSMEAWVDLKNPLVQYSWCS